MDPRNAQLGPLIEELATVMLRWNLEANPIGGKNDLHISILQGVGEKHLQELEKTLKVIVQYVDQPLLAFIPLENATYYNPLHFLHNREAYTVLCHMPCVIPEGMLHDDLHPGNVMVRQGTQAKGDQVKAFHVIDFALSRSGNALFDLAYLEVSILLNSRGGFHRMLDLQDWWELEKHLVSKSLPSEKRFPRASNEDLQRVLPIRRALDAQIKQNTNGAPREDYWIAFLAASVEAGFDLARKVYSDRSLQRMAFLTAVSRFNRLLKLLNVDGLPLTGIATIHWPGDERVLGQVTDEGRVAVSSEARTPLDVRKPLELVWPGEVTQLAALYDPWEMVVGIWSDLTGGNDQGVLLVGERKSGKSSFLNCIQSLFVKNEETFRVVRLHMLSIPQSAQSFAITLLQQMCESVGLHNIPEAYNVTNQDFNSEAVFRACQSIVNVHKDSCFVVFIDEFDAILDKALSKQDAEIILHLLSRLLTHPHLPVRLLLTATKPEVLEHYLGGTDFLINLGSWNIPLCSEGEVEDLVKRLESGLLAHSRISFTYSEDALGRILHYSGGHIYFVKMAVKAVSVSGAQGGKGIVTAQVIDRLMREVSASTEATPFRIRNIHNGVFLTMKNIYLQFFSGEEQQFMQLLAKAGGTLQASSLAVSKQQLANAANNLYERGYILKTVTEEGEKYQWRIGFWQLFLENHYQLKYQERQGKQ